MKDFFQGIACDLEYKIESRVSITEIEIMCYAELDQF